MQPRHVLVVDPDPQHAKRLREALLHQYKAMVTTAGRSDIAVEELKSIHKVPIDFIIVDIHQPDALYVGSVQKIRAVAPSTTPLLVITSDLSEYPQDKALMFQALHAGADAYLSRGTLWKRFKDAIWLALEKNQLSV